MSAEYSRSVCRAMQDVMQRVLNGASFSQLSDTEKDYLYQCSKDGLISGLVFEQMISGRLVCEIRGAVKLTPAGKSFIENLEEAERLEKEALNEVSDNVPKPKANRKEGRSFEFVKTLVGAIIANIISLLFAKLPKIIDFLVSLIKRSS